MGRVGKISKAIRVETNDPANSKFKLELTGQVKQLAIITLSKRVLAHAFISGTVGEKISKVVTLLPDACEPFQILQTNTLNESDFRYSMEEIEIDGKKAYQFMIENTRMTAGRYLDKIFIFTDSMVHNPLTIMVNGDIREALPENKED
jgi:hypothetical protein